MAGSRRKTTSSASNFPRPSRLQRVRRLVVVFFLLLLVAVAVLPTVVSRTFLRQRLLNDITAATSVRVETESGEFSWWGNQTLRDVKVVDPAGQQVLTAEVIRLQRSLIGLLLNRNHLGKIEVVRPVGLMTIHAGGNTLTDLFGDLTADSPDALRFELEIIDGALRFVDQVLEQEFLLHGIALAARRAERLGLEGKLNVQQTDASGYLSFALEENEDARQQLTFTAERVPLQLFHPWLLKRVPGGHLAGDLSAAGDAHWDPQAAESLSLATSGHLEVRDFEFSADALAGDRLRSKLVKLPWQLEAREQHVQVHQLALQTDWAELRARGGTSLGSFQGGSLARYALHIEGEANLAPLAAMLPEALHLRPGARIDGGRCTFRIAPTGENSGNWQGELRIANLSGTDKGRAFAWREPITAEFVLASRPNPPRLERLRIAAPFAHADFTARQDTVEGALEINLDRLAADLAQFVDLDQWQLRGRSTAALSLQQSLDGRFEATAEIDLDDLYAARGDQPLWSEKQVKLVASAAGTSGTRLVEHLKTGSLRLSGPGDSLALELLQPVDLREAAPSWSCRVKGSGSLETWRGRLSPWLPGELPSVTGDAQWNAALQIAPHRVQLTDCSGSITDFTLAGKETRVHEPLIEFSGEGVFDRGSFGVQTPEMQLAASSFSLRTRQFALEGLRTDSPRGSGSIAFRADLERLAKMFAPDRGDSPWPAGQASGVVHLKTEPNRLAAQFTVNAEPLQLVRPSRTRPQHPEVIWHEPRLTTQGTLSYDSVEQRVQLADLRIDGQTLSLAGSAHLAEPFDTKLLQAGGQMNYQAADFSRLLSSYLGPDVQIEGDGRVLFQATGPLEAALPQGTKTWLQHWQGSAETGWQRARLFGLALSAARVKAELGGGQLRLSPLDVSLGEGRLTAQPHLALPPHPVLTLPRGPLIHRVQISQEVSESMLKYAAPILADATRSQGEFSVELEGLQLPLDHPKQARSAGRLVVHRLLVTPSPMVEDLARLIAQVEAITRRKQFVQAAAVAPDLGALSIKEQQIDFHVERGRVHHRNLVFEIDDVPVESYGSVGFDQTLSVVFMVPIQQKWVDGERALRGLAGQKLQIPVSGTFDSPKIDSQAIASLSQQLLQGAIQQTIGDELNRQLEKLFK